MPKTAKSHPELYSFCKKIAPRILKELIDKAVMELPDAFPSPLTANEIKEHRRKFRAQLEKELPISLMNHPRLFELAKGTKYEKYFNESETPKPK